MKGELAYDNFYLFCNCYGNYLYYEIIYRWFQCYGIIIFYIDDCFAWLSCVFINKKKSNLGNCGTGSYRCFILSSIQIDKSCWNNTCYTNRTICNLFGVLSVYLV